MNAKGEVVPLEVLLVADRRARERGKTQMEGNADQEPEREESGREKAEKGDEKGPNQNRLPLLQE